MGTSPEPESPSFKSFEKNGADSVQENPLDKFDPELVKRAWRKVDWHVMPVAVLLYLSSYIDRYEILCVSFSKIVRES